MSKSVIDVIIEYGKAHGYDGVFDEYGYSYTFDDMENVDQFGLENCELGYAVKDCLTCPYWYESYDDGVLCPEGKNFNQDGCEPKNPEYDGVCIIEKPPLRVPGQMHRCKECAICDIRDNSMSHCRDFHGAYDSNGDYTRHMEQYFTLPDAWACEKFEEKK
jgi:hypothetical protein